MYVIKNGNRYIKYNERGRIEKVDTLKEATQFHSQRIAKSTLVELTKSNYKELSIEPC